MTHCLKTKWTLGLAAFAIAAMIAPAAAEPITNDVLLNAQDRSDLWVNYGRNYAGWRFDPSEQINRETVKRLVPKWTHQTGVLGGGFEVSAAVFPVGEGKTDYRMFLTTPNSHLICVNPETGEEIWRYDHEMPEGVNLCCGPVNRGVGVLGDKIYYGTLDAHLLCFDAATGIMLWDREVADYRDSYSLTLCPLIVKDKVLVGVGGAEYGVRGFVDAYNAETGELEWRFYTIPEAGEPGGETWEGDSWMNGGGSTWVTGTYDPELDLIYWGVGNPSPDFNGDVREGDNLYTDSVVALNPDTGALEWHFQMTPHDIFDWDGVSEPVLIDTTIDGREVKALLQANRNGYLYAIDRTNGEFLYARPYSKVDWANIDERGMPVTKPEILAQSRKHVCPGILGGKNWQPTAYSPRTGMLYVPDMNLCSSFTTMDITFRRGLPYYGGTVMNDAPDTAEGYIKAMDVKTGEIQWQFDAGDIQWGGILATGGGLIFAGGPDGYLRAFNDETGEVLWQYQTGNGIFAPPTSFTIDGKQYIALASGWNTMGDFMQRASRPQRGCAFFVFGLFEE